MSRPVKIVCDGCGRQKETANHWWTVQVHTSGERLIIIPGSRDQEAGPFIVLDFCGRECALKRISEQMGKHGDTTE